MDDNDLKSCRIIGALWAVAKAAEEAAKEKAGRDVDIGGCICGGETCPMCRLYAALVALKKAVRGAAE
jgi:hypothetical protein